MSYPGHHHSLSEEGSREFDASIPPATRKDTIHLTPYSRPPLYSPSDYHDGRRQQPHWSGDPRSSSTQSLLPEHPPGDGRRTLLLVYIHGFMGNDTSFQKFPAHVHNLLTITLAETHAIHTKIYPRYKSRGAIELARDAFSHWLSPHESPDTDVILLGHSLGGILAAEVALLNSSAPGSREVQRHRILGTLSFDTPFLGIHPSVVKTGIGSLFRSKPNTENKHHDDSQTNTAENSTQGLSDSLAATHLNDSSTSPFALPTNDPNYDPAFPNDVRLAQRSQLDGAIHFITKYSDRLAQATRQYVTSHVEFGSCLADYPSLKRRYKAIRALEDIDVYSQAPGPDGRFLRRVRFANYYTASTGRLKPQAPQQDLKQQDHRSESELSQNITYDQSIRARSLQGTSQDSVDEFSQGTVTREPINMEYHGYESSDRTPSNVTLEVPSSISGETTSPQYEQEELDSYPLDIHPPIPPAPDIVPAFDPSPYATKAEQKEASKEHSQRVKNYQKAMKERNKAIRNREKAINKFKKTTAKEQRQQAGELSRDHFSEPFAEEPKCQIDSGPVGRQSSDHSVQPTAPKKDRKFCTLPAKDANGVRDPLWVRVHMTGMDEVVAHQSLFFPSEAYERLVGDVAAQIEQWVNDDATARMIMTEMADMNT